MITHQQVNSGTAQAACRPRALPDLHGENRSAKILALARMEQGPVSAQWFAARTGLKQGIAAALLDQLCARGCAMRISVRPGPPKVLVPQFKETMPLALYAQRERGPGLIRSALDRLRKAVERERAWASTMDGQLN